MDSRRSLVVNADDFGQSRAINQGIMAAHASGIVTSASLMVRWPAVVDAVEYSQAHSDLSLGLHVDLGEWSYHDHNWRAHYEVVPLQDESAVLAEVHGQLARFRDLTGHNPTHLDSHQHTHCRQPARSILLALATELAVPLRHYSHVAYCGAFYGQTSEGESRPDWIGLENLFAILGCLSAGATELVCHPGIDVDDVSTMYRGERKLEVATLCDPRVQVALAELDIRLCTFASISAA